MLNPTSLIRAGVTGAAAAIAMVIVIFVIATAISGDLEVTRPGQDGAEALEGADIVVPIIMGTVAGLVLAAISRRFSSTPTKVFLGTCVVGLVLYGTVSFSAADEVSTAIWLNIMHIVAAVPIVGLIHRALETNTVQTN